MDTRDQTLTKLTRLHDRSHPTHHRPASLWWNYSRTAVSIMKLVMEDGWWWRHDESPSSEPRTDSRSALPRGFRAWRQLRIVKHDDFFSLICFLIETQYMEVELESETQQGAHEIGGRPPPSWEGCGPPGLHLWRGFFIISKITFVEFQDFWSCAE